MIIMNTTLIIMIPSGLGAHLFNTTRLLIFQKCSTRHNYLDATTIRVMRVGLYLFLIFQPCLLQIIPDSPTCPHSTQIYLWIQGYSVLNPKTSLRVNTYIYDSMHMYREEKSEFHTSYEEGSCHVENRFKYNTICIKKLADI